MSRTDLDIKAMVKLTDALTKVMDYWLVAGSECSDRFTSMDVILRVCQLGVMYYWKYGQRSMVTISMSISSNTSSHDTWSWRVISMWRYYGLTWV